MPKSKPSVADEVMDVVPQVMRVIRKEFRSQRDPDLTLPEFRGLAFINRNSGCALNEVAEQVGLEPPSASKLVENLVRRGLVKRVSDPVDRRRLQLSILPKGERSIAAAFDHTREFLAGRLAHLTEEDRENLLHSMDILKSAFSGEPIGQSR